jgi:cytochrome d ubiquinol oxidase subunit I
MFDPIFLSRLQFAFNVGFHILWPALNVGLALFLVIIEAKWLFSKDEVYLNIYKFWSKIFALSFGMGVVTGIPMSFQFGTNFAKFSKLAGPLVAPLLSIEIMSAFFLEATFLGLMLFGWKKVHPRIHFLATIFVCIGVHNSAIWILVVNSWMHTPAGAEIVNGTLVITDWMKAIFNPSFPYRLAHMLTASYITCLLVVSGSSAYVYWSKYGKKQAEIALKTLKVSVPLLFFIGITQVGLGDMHGLNTFHHQPAKVAAMEGNWETKTGVPTLLFAIPDQKNEKNHFEIGIPKMTSLILTHSFDGEVVGLKDFAPEMRPNVPIIFFSFRIMVGLGFMFILLSLVSLASLRMKKIPTPVIFGLIAAAPMGFVAVIAGWMVTEVGRQPWIIYGLMKIHEGASAVSTGVVLWSFTTFIALYMILFFFYLVYLLGLIKKGPEIHTAKEIYGVQATKI